MRATPFGVALSLFVANGECGEERQVILTGVTRRMVLMAGYIVQNYTRPNDAIFNIHDV